MFHQSILEPAQLPGTAHTPRLSHPEHSRMGDPGWLSPHPRSTEKGKPPARNSIARQRRQSPCRAWRCVRPGCPAHTSGCPRSSVPGSDTSGGGAGFPLATQMLGQRADLPDFIPGPVLEGRSLFSTPSSRILRLFFFFFHYFSK